MLTKKASLLFIPKGWGWHSLEHVTLIQSHSFFPHESLYLQAVSFLLSVCHYVHYCMSITPDGLCLTCGSQKLFPKGKGSSMLYINLYSISMSGPQYLVGIQETFLEWMDKGRMTARQSPLWKKSVLLLWWLLESPIYILLLSVC